MYFPTSRFYRGTPRCRGYLLPVVLGLLGTGCLSSAQTRDDYELLTTDSATSEPRLDSSDSQSTMRLLSVEVTDEGSVAVPSEAGISNASGLKGEQKKGVSTDSNVNASQRPQGKTTFVLSRSALIEQVLKVHPSVEVAKQTWKKILSKYGQAKAWSDLNLTYEFAPISIFTGHKFGQTIRLSQKFEWPGKQELRGQIVLAQADASKESVAQVKLKLATTASLLFDEYTLATQLLALNQEHISVITKLRATAEAHYESGHGSQQDVLRTQLQLEELQQDNFTYQTRKKIAQVQLNTLLHRPAEAPLPEPPKTLGLPKVPTRSLKSWRKLANEKDPTLIAISKQIKTNKLLREYADRSYYPDFSIGTSYSRMWPNASHQWMVGITVAIPTDFEARRSKGDEATAEILRLEGEVVAERDRLHEKLAESLLKMEEVTEKLDHLVEKILPTAQRTIDAAEARYIEMKVDLDDLLKAERQYQAYEHQKLQLVAKAWRAYATFVQALGTVKLSDVEADSRSDAGQDASPNVRQERSQQSSQPRK